MAYVIDKNVCTGCGECEPVCPTSAIVAEDGKFAIVADDCIDCSICQGSCPVDAISEA